MFPESIETKKPRDFSRGLVWFAIVLDGREDHAAAEAVTSGLELRGVLVNPHSTDVVVRAAKFSLMRAALPSSPRR